MRHSTTTPALLAFANLAAASVLHDARGPCNANNCARAVTGTRDKEPNQTVRWADCVSFLRTTVTPDVVTSTLTATVPATATAVTVVRVTTTTTVPPDYPNKAKRAVTVTPSVVPAYASACTNPAAYSSACSCWGVSAQTSTAAAPTVYVTATTTVTETTITRTSTTAVATQTVVADASCNGRPLGTQWQYCADDSRYACKCGKDTGGAVVCFRIPLSQLNCFTSEYPPCNRNADCASGRRCQTAEYSECSRNSCDPVGPGYCAAAKVGLAVAAAMVELSRAGAQVAVPAE